MNEIMINMAIDAITAEIAAGSATATLYKERGRLRMLKGDSAGAMEDLKKAIEISPDIVDDLTDGSFSGNIKSCH